MTGIEAGQQIMAATVAAFEKAGFTDSRIAKELSLIAFADMADFVDIDESGIVKAIPLDQLKKKYSKIIKKIKEKRVIRTVKGTAEKPDGEEVLDSTFEFELYSKLDAIQMAIDVKGIKQPQQHDVNLKAAIEISLIDKFEVKP